MVANRIAMSRVTLLCLALMLVWQVSAVTAADQGAGPAGQSWQKEVLARVGAVQGDTKVQRAGEAKFKKIGAKSPLYIMDFVATGKNSKLWWQGVFNAFTPSDRWKPGTDVTHGSLGADSVFGFKQFERTGASYRFVGYVQKGTVRFIKTLPNTNPPSTFTIGAHTAWIEALYSDRAADFIVESKNEALTTVTVLWGKVRVRNISPQTKESRVLTSCQEVDVERDQEPSDIKWVSSDTMKELVKRTTIPRTLPEDVPSCERLKTEVLLDVTAVYLPPPGVALFPAVPVPVPGDKTECCPPGQMYDPRTGRCRCPCPEGELPPITVVDNNGSAVDGLSRPCGSCRRGATFNSETCTCECPCPQGFFLPGQGCVPQCPLGYSQAWDSSASPPYRCLYCVQYPPGTVVDPIPPPLKRCSPDGGRVPAGPDKPDPVVSDGRPVAPEAPEMGERPTRPVAPPEAPEVPETTRPRAGARIPTLIMSVGEQCDPCDVCVDGYCVPKVCRTGFYLDRVSCECVPITNNVTRMCGDGQQCPPCQRCQDGVCVNATNVICTEQQRLNLSTCQCEPLNGRVQRGCQSNEQCPPCQKCREGQCLSVIVCGPDQRLNPDTCQCELVGSKLCPGVECGPQQRLNVDTCQCESSATPVIPKPTRPETPEHPSSIGTPTPVRRDTRPQCRKSIDCPVGQVCRKGKCVSEDEPSGPSESGVTGSYSGPGSIRIGPQFGTQVGPGVGGTQPGSPGTQRQVVPKLTPQMPIQRVPRGGRVN